MSPGTQPDDALHDRPFGICVAIFFGFFFLFFAAGLVFDPRRSEIGTVELLGYVAMTVWMGGMAIAGGAMAANCAWSSYLMDRLFSCMAVALQLVFVRGILIEPPFSGTPHVLFCFCVIAWIGIGLMMYVGNWRRTDYWECALWPVPALLIGGWIGAFSFGVVCSFVAAGSAIGDRIDHPYLGGIAGFAAFMAIAVIAHRFLNRAFSD